MKKLLLLTTLMVLMISCKSDRYSQNSPEIETYKSSIKDYDEKNWEQMTSHYSDTAKIFFNTTNASMLASELQNYHTESDAAFSSRGFKEEGQEYEMVIDDKGRTWVNFWGTWQATLAANNKQMELPVHLTAQFIDGKIVQEYGYWDNAPIVMEFQKLEAENAAKAAHLDNLQIIEGIYSNFAKGDIPAFLAVLDPKVEWNEAESFIYGDNKPLVGPDALVKGVLERIGADWEYWKIADLKLNGMSNSMVLATARYQAKHKTTGKLLDAQVAHVWSLKNGKVIKFQQYTDTKQASEAIQ